MVAIQTYRHHGPGEGFESYLSPAYDYPGGSPQLYRSEHRAKPWTQINTATDNLETPALTLLTLTGRFVIKSATNQSRVEWGCCAFIGSSDWKLRL